MTKKSSEIYTPNFISLVSSIYSAVLYNLGEITIKETDTIVTNLNMARYNISLLKVLKEKTEGNLNEEELIALEDYISASEKIYAEHLKNEEE